MIYYIYYGEISKENQNQWTEMTEPFDVLSWEEKMYTHDWVKFLHDARECFSDEVSVDWGSFAWKATKNQLLSWANRSGNSLENRGRLKDGITYGVVFIEMS